MSDYTEIFLQSFSDHLKRLEVSPSTYKNYLSDIRYYFHWSKSHSQGSEHVLSLPTLLAFRDSQVSQPITTTNRHLSALRKLCRFAFSSQLIATDPSSQITNLTTPTLPLPNHNTLSQFTVFLRSQKASPVTVKNYVSDIRHYLSLNTQLEIYLFQLQQSVSATNKRRLSSLKKFLEFLKTQSPTPELVPKPPATLASFPPDSNFPTPPANLSPFTENPDRQVVGRFSSADEFSVKTPISRKSLIISIIIIALSLLLLISCFFLLLPPQPPLINPSPVSF